MFTHMTATMNGLSTIRAFSAQDMLIEEFDNIQDHHSSAWFLFIASSRCFGYWLDIICITFIGVAVFILLTFNASKYGTYVINKIHLNTIFYSHTSSK